jgi:hypothetical protein
MRTTRSEAREQLDARWKVGDIDDREYAERSRALDDYEVEQQRRVQTARAMIAGVIFFLCCAVLAWLVIQG